MRVLALLLITLAVSYAADCPGGLNDSGCAPKPSSGLSVAARESHFATNMHHIEKLDVFPRKCITDFVKALQLHDTTIRLGHPIVGGHSIMYEFVEGPNPSLVQSLAPKYHLKIVATRQCKCQNCCGRILLPGKDVRIVEAAEVPGKRQLRANMPKQGGAPPYPKIPDQKESLKDLKDENNKHAILKQQVRDKERTKFFKLTPDQKDWYYDNNRAQISKMNPLAQPFVTKFLEDLRSKAPNTIVHFMRPVNNGFSVRFTMVEGPKNAVYQFANQCGLKLQGRTLVAPGGAPADAEPTLESDKKSHIEAGRVEQNDGGSADLEHPLNPVPTTARNVVQELPDKWIEADIAALEMDANAHHEDSDALVLHPQHKPQRQAHGSDDDDDSFVHPHRR